METVLESKNQKTIIGPDRIFVIIGERINPTGRKKLAEELLQGNLEAAQQHLNALEALLSESEG